jgi:aspartyl-tRNA(Asn)/glutamyl-tRNA(Gln) amidotransferase subunit A
VKVSVLHLSSDHHDAGRNVRDHPSDQCASRPRGGERVSQMQTGPLNRRTFLLTATSVAAAAALKPAFGESQDLATSTLKEASEMLRRRVASPVELTQACLKRIDRYNPALNAFITVTAEQAITAARVMEDEQRRGKWRGPLHGIPIALKDNIDTAGIRTTAASELFKDRVPFTDAEVVTRLKNAGAILIGKTNLHEFAYGGSSSVSYFGPVHNPWALDRVPGGSSGGSAAATAAGLCFGSLGTDTAGSLRIPASYCGIVGLKPTYGRVSNRGVVPLSWTLDHVGPLCLTVEDAAIVLSVIAGYDELDPSTSAVPVPDYNGAFNIQVSKLRLGVPRKPFFEALDEQITKATEAAIEVLRKLTTTLQDIKLPEASIPIDEIYAKVRSVEAYTYHRQWISESPEKYQAATRQRIIENAEKVKTTDYVQARLQLDLLRRQINKVFTTVDLLVLPTLPSPPVLITEATNPAAVSIRNTSPFDVLGLPAISVPCGFTNSGLPVGLQIVGAPFMESTVLALARAYEKETEWHKRHPTF